MDTQNCKSTILQILKNCTSVYPTDDLESPKPVLIFRIELLCENIAWISIKLTEWMYKIIVYHYYKVFMETPCKVLWNVSYMELPSTLSV